MKNASVLSPDERLEMIAAARFRSEGKKQEDIAAALNINQTKVSRLLRIAIEEEQILADAPAINRKNIPKKEWDKVEEIHFASRSLQAKLSHCAPPNIRFCVREFGGDHDQFTRAAATRVVELLSRSQLAGVMSGQTMFKLVQGIQFVTRSSDSSPRGNVQCIPLCGDPIHLMNQREVDYSASHLAASLGECVSEKPVKDLPCLTGVPAYISSRLLQNKEFQEFLLSIPGYHRIFAPHQKHGGSPLVDLIDTIITGIGVVYHGKGEENLTAAFIRERIEQNEETQENLSNIVLGDIGGLLIEKTPSQRRRVDKLNEGWIGIREKHFKRVAEASKEGGPPGVIVIAVGKGKARVAFEAICRGFVNELIADSELSKEIQMLAELRKER